jgi:tetratricopeptide (TPR) repeat protein
MAEVYIVDAEAIAPNDPLMYYLYGKRAAVDGDTAKAIPQFYRAIHLDTTLNLAYKELAGIYLNQHKYDSAMVFLTVGKINNANEPYYDYIEGKVLEQLNLKSSSKALFVKALNADSTFSYAYNALGNLLRKEGKDSLAILYFEKEVHFNPYNNPGVLNLAHLYEKNNQGNKAIPLLQRVLAKDTANKTIKSSLEKLYIQYPELKPVVKSDTTAKKSDTIVVKPKTDTSKIKPGAATPATTPTAKPVAPVKPPVKKNPIPRVSNPDSMKIEIRPDSLK